MGMQEKLQELRNGFETAYIDKTSTSNLAYKPQFISNDYKQGKKVLSSIEDELMTCDQFQISVAFITMGGITPLLQTLKELEKIVMIRQLDGVYRLEHAVTATQKTILDAFGLNEGNVRH